MLKIHAFEPESIELHSRDEKRESQGRWSRSQCPSDAHKTQTIGLNSKSRGNNPTLAKHILRKQLIKHHLNELPHLIDNAVSVNNDWTDISVKR